MLRAPGTGDVRVPVSGRVLLDGKPVRRFGVSYTRSVFVGALVEPVEVRSETGQFVLRIPEGTWDLIIAGPGFARRVLRHVRVGWDRTRMPRDILVSSGTTVTGIVTDVRGMPVSGATVRIGMHANRRATSELGDLALGNGEAVTDARGAFRIEDVALQRSLSIAAYGPDNRSLPVQVSPDTGPLALVLRPVGKLVGTIAGVDDADVVVFARDQREHHEYRAPVDHGTFGFELIPEGQYSMGVFVVSNGRASTFTFEEVATVEAGQTTRVVLPARPHDP